MAQLQFPANSSLELARLEDLQRQLDEIQRRFARTAPDVCDAIRTAQRLTADRITTIKSLARAAE
jgi:hypothetical protein